MLRTIEKIIVLFAVFASMLSVEAFLHAAQFPTPVGFVNDFASMLSPQARSNIEQELQNFENKTSAEISVVAIESLNNAPIEDYAARLLEEWNIGKKGKDNGVLLLIAKDDRKVRIEVGYGLEPIITDGRAGDIIRNDLAPAFRDGDFDQGVRQALRSIENLITSGQPETPQETVRNSVRRSIPFLFESNLGFLLVTLLIIYLFNFMARSKRTWPGGVVGGAFGVFLGWLFISVILGAALFFVLGALGLLLDYILSKNYTERKIRGLPIGFWSSGGGFRGGGGGFGGFGGGGSGGGGSSGSW